MGTIAEKLSYLNDTKDLFKDRLNSLGAEITSSTTFRNYLNWLDIFYGEVSDKTDISANGVVGRTSQNTAILPSDYTQVDYIESSGTQYIDTGVNADTNLRVVLDMAFTRGGSANQNVGAINLPGGSNNARYHILTGGTTDGYIRIFINDNGLNLGLWDNDRHLFDINPLEGYASYDDAIRTIPTDIKDVGLNFWLFGRNAIGTALYYSYVKQWACQLYYENELVRDFIPCYRNSDNEVGLYDLVNDVFYTNQGTGAFTYGSVVSIPNPDYPQPINNLSGDVPYKVSGKNKIPTNISNWESGQYNVAGAKHNMVSRIRLKDLVPIKPNTTYYFDTFDTTGFRLTHNFIIRECDENGDFINNAGTINNQGTFTTRNDTYYLMVTIGTSSTTSGETFEDYQTYFDEGKLKPFICLDSEIDKSYELYIEPRTFDIPLKSKNLFDKDNANIINGFFSSTKIYTSSTSLARTAYIRCQPNTTYTVSKTQSARFALAYSEEIPSNNVSINGYIQHNAYTEMSITTDSTAKYLCVFYYLYDTDTLTEQQVLDRIQIEQSSTATNYEPYYDIELCKINTYEDKIYSSDGRFYLDKQIDKKTENSFTGIFIIASTLADNLYGYACNTQGISSYSELGAIISNIFVPKILGSQTDTTNPNNVRFNMGIAKHPNNNQVVITIDKKYLDTGTTTEFSNFLNNNNFEYYCVLATPTTTEITQENYPSLYNALKQIQDYLTAYKINKEFILGYSSPEIEY